MAIISRSNFYFSVAAFRRRRRRTISVYSTPSDYLYEQKKSIQTSNTPQSYEEFYMQYNNIEKPDAMKAPVSEEMKFVGSAITKNYYDVQRSLAKRKKESKPKKGKLRKNPIITEQGQENSTGVVRYKDKDGKYYYKQGGTIAWRHNNPGNLSFSSMEVAKRHGAIDVVLDRDKSGRIVHRWGVFENEEAGEKAMRDKLKEKRFSVNPDTGAKRTIAESIGIYAPASENNVRAYVEFVRKHSGLDVYNKSISDLNSSDFNKLVEAMKERESAVVGDIIYPEEEQKNSSINNKGK